MKTYSCLCFVILSNLLGLSLIYFDNCDGSPLENGSEGHLLEECCGQTSCSLLVWDDRTSTICQASDLSEVFHDIDCNNGRPDIHIPNILIQSTKALQKNGSAECLSNTITGYHDRVVSCQLSKTLEETHSNGLKMQNVNIYLPKYVLNISTNNMSHLDKKLISPSDKEIQKNVIQSRKFPHKLKIRLQNHYKFLLLNSTIEEPSLKTNLSRIYETLKNSDVSKVLVKVLQDKLKLLKEKEELSFQNEFGSLVSEVAEPPSMSKTSTMPSKWDIVRKAFLKNHRFDMSTPEHQAVTTKLKPEDSLLVYNEDKHNVAQKISNTIESIDSSQEFKKIMDQFYAASKLPFTQSKENVKYENDFDKGADYDTLEYFDVNLPYNIEQVGADTNHLPQNFSPSTTEKCTEANLKFDSLFEEGKLELKESSTSMLNTNFKVSNSPSSKSYANPNQNKSWKSVLWSINNNVSWGMSNRFKNMFIWHNKITNNSSRVRKTIKLNENFLLTLNSKNKSKEEPSELFEGSKIDINTKPPNAYNYPSYSSSSESASSESEDLYNNSIVFVVRERNTTGLNKDTKWRSILNFFHIAKAIPCPQGKNPCIDSLNRSCSFNKPTSGEFENKLQREKDIVTKVPEIIQLPERLMPEALEGRQLNDTGFLFYDSSGEEEDKKLEDSNITSNTFLFFFK